MSIVDANISIDIESLIENDITHFKIYGISSGTLYKNDGVEQIAKSGTGCVTIYEMNSGLKCIKNNGVDSDTPVQFYYQTCICNNGNMSNLGDVNISMTY